MDHAYRTRWSGKGYINKLLIISIVIYVLKLSGIRGAEHFCNMKLIYLKHLQYSKDALWSGVEAGNHR